jgi:hypothetical protein
MLIPGTRAVKLKYCLALGITAIVESSMVCWTLAPCTSTIGLSPVTVTVSSRAPRLNCAFTVAVKLPVSLMPSRLTVLKPVSVNVST